MGWLTLPAPGTELGPCEGGCAHKDCAATRRDAATPCRICGEPIGYDRPFHYEEGGAVHHSCLVDEVEGRR